MAWQDVRSHYQERDEESPTKTVPETIVPGERYMESTGYGRWAVYDWHLGECRSCRGYGHFGEDDEPTIDRRGRKCLDCGGSCTSGPEPELVIDGLSEEDAKVLAFASAQLARLTATPSAEIVEAAAKAGFESMAATMLEKGYSREVHRFENQPEDVMADWRSVAAHVIAEFQRIRSGE